MLCPFLAAGNLFLERVCRISNSLGLSIDWKFLAIADTQALCVLYNISKEIKEYKHVTVIWLCFTFMITGMAGGRTASLRA